MQSGNRQILSKGAGVERKSLFLQLLESFQVKNADCATGTNVLGMRVPIAGQSVSSDLGGS